MRMAREHISSINNENGQTSGHGGRNLSLEKNDDGSWAVSGKENQRSLDRRLPVEQGGRKQGGENFLLAVNRNK